MIQSKWLIRVVLVDCGKMMHWGVEANQCTTHHAEHKTTRYLRTFACVDLGRYMCWFLHSLCVCVYVSKCISFSWHSHRRYEMRTSVIRSGLFRPLSQMNGGIAISSNQSQRGNIRVSVAAGFELLLSTWQEDIPPRPVQILFTIANIAEDRGWFSHCPVLYYICTV